MRLFLPILYTPDPIIRQNNTVNIFMSKATDRLTPIIQIIILGFLRSPFTQCLP